ncbi:gfo/Idh/MocA family oxidoreductase, partial [Amaricoccus sp. HAR-UPW-R2A-40]
VVAAYSPTEARRAAFAADWPDFPLTDRLEDALTAPGVEAVLILTPPNTHLALVRQAAMAGKHVLLEKPLETATDRAEELVVRCLRQKVTLGVVLQHRFRPAAERLKALLDEGALGEILGCSAADPALGGRSPITTNPGRGTRDRDGGGVLLTQGIHTLDLMLWLAGPVASVQGYARTLDHRMETEDTACAALHFRSGALGVVEATTSAFPGFPERIDLTCSLGSARLEGAGLTVLWRDGRRLDLAPEAGPGGTGADPMAFSHAAHRALIADFAAAIREDRPPRITGRDAMRVHRLIDAILESESVNSSIIPH